MRVLLFTGKGGVGKTSVAAATAARAARAGQRTLVMSTDPAHSLADAFGTDLSSGPAQVAERLEAEQIDPSQRLEENWRDIQDYLVSLLAWAGVGEVEAEELSVIPGLEEVFSLIDVRRHVDAGEHDLLVVDCAPTGETLRLLSLPDVLGWYIERIFPVERKVARAVRPVLGRMTTMPLPEDETMGSIERLYRDLEAVRTILTDGERTSVRLVVNAERMVVAEARRTFTYLHLFGYHVDGVVVNRLLPEEVSDPYFARWKQRQAEHLQTIEEGFDGLPVLTAPLLDDEPVGAAALTGLADHLYNGQAPTDVLANREPMHFEPEDGGYRLGLSLPFVDKDEVDLLRRGDELYVKIGAYTRSIVLPAALRRCEVVSAGFSGDRLQIEFATATAEMPR